MLRPVWWALVLVLVSVGPGCASKTPPESPATPAASSPPAFAFSPPPTEEERELLDAQIQLTRTVGLGLLVSATILYTTTSTCPTPEDVVKAGLLSPGLSSRDVWGTPFRIACSPEGHLSVISAGPDLAFQTPDDLRIDGE